MKKLLPLFVVYYLLIYSEPIYSQNLSVPHPVSKCGADKIHQEMMLTNQVYAERMATYETSLQNKQSSTNKTTGVVYKIPVVVHVMHRGEQLGSGANVSEVAIRKAITSLNEIYRKVPGTAGDGNGVDTEIEFVLAVRDPNGNCTNGINRVNMSAYSPYMTNGVNRAATGGITDATLKSIIVWNQTEYYNIWLVSEIDNNEGDTGVQGYAYFAAAHGTSLDGAVIVASNFTGHLTTIAAHELGHAFNLYHTFEGDGTGTNCPPTSNGCGFGVGDCCADIPAHIRSSSNCGTGTNSCDGTTSRELFIHNYMDYSDYACQNMFTADQKTRIHATVTGLRASLLGPENGGTCMSLVPVATAGVNFTSSASVLCGINQTIMFTDISACIPNSYNTYSSFSGISHSWTITDGTTTYTSTLQNPSITFTQTGTYNVTLSVTNTQGTTSHTKSGMIVVTGGAPVAACTPNSSFADYYWQTIYNTTFNTISSFTSRYKNTAYTNFVCTHNTIVTSGNTYTMSISANAEGLLGNEVFEVYIDYDNNGVFNTSSEFVFSGTATSGTAPTFTTNITIPTTAVQNTLLRMRVIGETIGIISSERNCTSNYYIGDIEDYGVYIIPPPCTPPAITSTVPSSRCGTGVVTLTAIADTGTINWYTVPTGGTAIATDTVFTTPILTATTTYYVDATNGTCTTLDRTAVTASVNPVPEIAATITDVSCYAACNGTTNVIVNGGTAPYYYSLLQGANPICQTADCDSICAGNYTVILTDTHGCTDTSTISIAEPQELIATATATDAGCATCSDGTATANVSGGTTPYTYSWAPSGDTTSTINNMPVNCYTVHVTDAMGCQDTATACISFVTGIQKAMGHEDIIAVYPNPAKTKFSIRAYAEIENLHIELYNTIGQVIIKESYKNVSTVSINMADATPGIYYLKASTGAASTIFKLIME